MAIVFWVHLCGTYMTMIVKKLYITWNIAVCRLYDLPRTAHTRFLTHIAGVPHVNLNLKCRFARQLETLRYKLFNIEYYTTLYLVMNGCSILKLKTATSAISAMKLTLYLTYLSNVEM